MPFSSNKNRTVSQNACKLCTPLGACIAIRGIDNSIPLLHGSQGCATYIRRYLISHYNEPIDIASSNFSDETAIFGGVSNLRKSLDNIKTQYSPSLIGIATTCLTETIGDDIQMAVNEYLRDNKNNCFPEIITMSTASYRGTHADGFHVAVKSIVEGLAEGDTKTDEIVVLPGMYSPADLRYLKEILSDFGLSFIMIPDYSLSLDGHPWESYQKISRGGTSVEALRKTGGARTVLDFTLPRWSQYSPADFLENKFDSEVFRLPAPFGVKNTDSLFRVLEKISGRKTPWKYIHERGRLIDSYIDAHKHSFGVKVMIYGPADFVIGIASIVAETGMRPVVCATGDCNVQLEDTLRKVIDSFNETECLVIEDSDFADIENAALEKKPDIMIGNSKGYPVSRKLRIPLIRTGFPVHDRMGGQRILHLGYRGSQEIFDRSINKQIEKKQESSPVGYTYM